MQLEAIIFASDSAVSLARLKEAFQDKYSKANYASFYNNWPCYNMVARLNWSKPLKVSVFKCVQSIVQLLHKCGLSVQPAFALSARNTGGGCLPPTRDPSRY